MKPTWIAMIAIAASLAVSIPTDAAKKHKPEAKKGSDALRVMVVDDSGRPVAGARVVVHGRRRRHSAGHTNALGVFESHRVSGNARVSAGRHGFIGATATVSVRADAVSFVELRLHGRLAIVAHAHEEHQLGIIRHDLHHDLEHDLHHDLTKPQEHPHASAGTSAPPHASPLHH